MSVAPDLAPVVFTLKNEASQPRACVKLDGVLYGIDRFRITKNSTARPTRPASCCHTTATRIGPN